MTHFQGIDFLFKLHGASGREDAGRGCRSPAPLPTIACIASYLPRPLKLTTCGLSRALSGIVSVPVCVVLEVGVKVMPTVQLIPAANVLPQVLPAKVNGPMTAVPERVAVTLLVLVTVTV